AVSTVIYTVSLHDALPIYAHSHAFHRALRGRTHAAGGDFWAWRDAMYAVAGVLAPDSYRRLARAVYAEMALAGVTAVGEFHYVQDRKSTRLNSSHVKISYA